MLLLNKPVTIHEPGTSDKSSGFTLDQAIHSTSNIVLTHQDNIVSFEFSALDFTNPKKNQYSYQLKGWDKDWVVTDYKNRRATYTNLPAGKYILRVKASNSNGYWNTTGASLRISVLPPPWKSWWAYALYTMVLGSLLLVFIRNQQNKVRYEHLQSIKLEQLVIKRTTELENKNVELQQTMDDFKSLKDVLPICSYCKKIKDDENSWEQMEAYISSHVDTCFSHGICPDCNVKVREEWGLSKK
jgi:hypothetical protein